MTRIARIVVPQVPHHVTQRGNRRQKIFLIEDDYAVYLDLLAARCRQHGVEIWSYCLMPNHIHLMLVPPVSGALSRVVGETHRRYTGYLNARLRVTGHLFQGRFGSIAMDERHCLAAARYIALNPVTAGLVEQARDWPWSSTAAHLSGQDDDIVTTRPLLERVENFTQFLSTDDDPIATTAVRQVSAIGRPLMETDRLRQLEQSLGVKILPRKRGPKPKTVANQSQDEFCI